LLVSTCPGNIDATDSNTSIRCRLRFARLLKPCVCLVRSSLQTDTNSPTYHRSPWIGSFAAIMAYHNSNVFQPTQTYLYRDGWSPDFDMMSWQGHPSTYRHPMGRHNHGFNDARLANDQDWVRGLNSTPPACHLTSDATYSSYHSPYEYLHRPYYSSSSTLYDSSSSSSDRLSPFIGSRASSLLPSSEPYHFEMAHQGLGFASCNDKGYEDRSCVTMQVIQKTADTSYEEPIDNVGSYAVGEPQEVVPLSSEDYDPPSSPYDQRAIPIAGAESFCDSSTPEPEAVSEPKPEPDSDYEPNPALPHHRRRAPKHRLLAAAKTRNRIDKRPSTQHPASPLTKEQPLTTNETARAFICPLAPYGCTATFNAKNEWKRHALTQHFRLGFWRCDLCTESSNGPNDFNRKDLFVQHVRRMHPTNLAPATSTSNSNSTSKKKSRVQGRVAAVEAALNKTAERCYQRTREAPETCCCVFCEETFEGDAALESRTEHVGKHMESRRKDGLEPVPVADWREDQELEDWLLRYKMIVRSKGVLELVK
jgi:hypothetical protein